MTSRLTGKEGVEFICKALSVYGIDYVEADDFRMAKDDDPTVSTLFKNLCADILALLVTDCRHALVQPRDYEDIDAVLTEASQLLGVPIKATTNPKDYLFMFLLILSQCGTKFIEGYRDLALGEAGFNNRIPRVDTYRSKPINRASAEQAAAAGARLSKLQEIAPAHVLQVLRRRESMKAQLEELEAEALKLAKKQGSHVGEWLAKTERKGDNFEEKLAAVQMEAIGEIAFWVWVESIPFNVKVNSPEPQKLPARRRPPTKVIDLSAAEKSLDACLQKIQSYGLHVRPNNQFLSD